MCRAELSGPRNINGTSASCFLSGVLVNVALVIALSLALHQVQRQLEVDLQAEITSLNLEEAAAQSHRAHEIASQSVRLTLTFAVLFNGALVLFPAFAIIRPRPVSPLALFR